ncbi:transposase InsO family protein [Duganella sp. 1224]|nr:transposase InsO family protein [Duganella sp. 1224]
MRLDYPLGLLCRVFEVSRSGFYAALERQPSQRAQDDERLKVAIKAAHIQMRETYGPLRLQPELASQGFNAGRDRIVRLWRELGLRCKQKRKFKATTNSHHAFPVAPNLLEQRFTPARPNEAWVSDITYVPTNEGWLYLAGIKDVFTCERVGYAMGARMTQELTAQALWRAVRSKRPAPGLILHSDRGSQYCADDYRALVAQFAHASIHVAMLCIPIRNWMTYLNSKNTLIHFRPPVHDEGHLALLPNSRSRIRCNWTKKTMT